MTAIQSILTDRHYQTWPSWHIVYEWEDELSALLDIPLINTPTPFSNPILTTLKRIDNHLLNGYLEYSVRRLKKPTSSFSLYYEMHMKPYKCFSNERSTLPVLIDFWLNTDVELLRRMYADCRYLLVTNLEVLRYLKEQRFRNTLIHFPMTLPSRYRLKGDEIFEKNYDLVIAGRKNSVLWKYLLRFEQQHPDIEYLYQVEQEGELYYRSNKQGIVGKFQSREEYIGLIRSARVALYATPGMDDGANRTSGFNPVTPRFLELLGAGCRVLARYPDTEETRFYNMNDISPAITSYDQFEEELLIALSSPAPMQQNANYLRPYYTSTLVELLKGV